MEKKNIWRITPKTNLHVGSENSSSYGLIDLSIQRDAVTGLPCINSSSLKGAINEYAVHCTSLTEKERITIFGSDKSKKENTTQKGGCTFFDAYLLAIPRPANDQPYELVTCKQIIEMFRQKVEALGGNISTEEIKSIIADTGVKLAEETEYTKFKELCYDDNLPIIARNVLDDGGISKNLWYEQVLPAESVLFTVIDDKDGKLTDAINGKTIQVGANGSIGYGFCKFEHL